MDHKKIRAIGAVALVVIWALLVGFSWFGPEKDISESERRELAKMPEISFKTIMNGKFMSEFEDYTLDQFPLRDTFRQVKSLFHFYGLQQGDNNDIYIANGYAAKQEYPLNETSVKYALGRFENFYKKYLEGTGSRVFMTVVPDKGYYMAQPSGHLAMDYEKLFDSFRTGMPYATYIDLTDTLELGDYYRTDTHWRQEKLVETAQRICEALGVTGPKQEDFTKVAVDRPFYGVYYGQAALPMEPETIYYLQSDLLKQCKVFNFESNAYGDVYDMTKLTSRDLYDVFLSGSRSMLTIENPNATTDRELIVVRDSFGSSMVPLLVQDYAKVTLVDIRYIQTDMLSRFIEIGGQDVLFLYSTLVLNNSTTIK